MISGKATFAAHDAANRFNLPSMHAEIVDRIAVGNKLVGHEHITGINPEPIEAIAAYEAIDNLIRNVWFFDAE